MGRVSRERRQRVIAGLEIGIAEMVRKNGGNKKERMLQCHVCDTIVPSHMAISHVKDCWGIEYPDVKSIPPVPPSNAISYHKSHSTK